MNNLANDQTARIERADVAICRGIKTRLYLGKDIEFATNEQTWFTVQSNYELQFIKLLEELQINYEYSPCAVRYFSESQQRNRTYTPDFCVFYNGFMVFVEIKSWFKRNATDVIEKFEALERWTQEQDNCICTMMYEGEVYGTAEHLKYVLDDIVAGKAWRNCMLKRLANVCIFELIVVQFNKQIKQHASSSIKSCSSFFISMMLGDCMFVCKFF